MTTSERDRDFYRGIPSRDRKIVRGHRRLPRGSLGNFVPRVLRPYDQSATRSFDDDGVVAVVVIVSQRTYSANASEKGPVVVPRRFYARSITADVNRA